MQIKIRHSLPEDAELLSDLIMENSRVNLLAHYNEEQWKAFNKYYSAKNLSEKLIEWEMYCAMLEDKIVGTIALHKNFIVGFYTRLGYQGKGIGRILMKFMEGIAISKGFKEIQLAASPEGLSFYYKNGWEKIKDTTFFYFDEPFEETLMKKKLM